MRKIILESMEDVVKFKTLIENKVDHYCGFHNNCSNIEICQKSSSITNLEARKVFLV
jgi:hypothetical protein